MTDTKRYIRFDGRLAEDTTFTPIPGWETVRVVERPARGDGAYRVELYDADGTLLVDATPVVEYDDICAPGGPERMRSARVTTYLPLHPDARRLVFRRGDRVIFERTVTETRPRLEVDLEVDGETAFLEWTTEPGGDIEVGGTGIDDHESGMAVTVALVADGVPFPLAVATTDDGLKVDLADLPGGETCRFLVLASDGLRSRTVVTDTVDVPRQPPTVVVTEPAEGSVFPADQPFSLIGRAYDATGGALPEAELTWLVDDEAVAEATARAAATELAPGDHTVTLRYADTASETVTVTVHERTDEQTAYRALVDTVDALE